MWEVFSNLGSIMTQRNKIKQLTKVDAEQIKTFIL